MKKILLGALLVSGLAGQSALAEIRTFDFTANVNSLGTLTNSNATSVGGIVNGTVVQKNDLIQGRFSFDDLGRDWTGATNSVGPYKVLDFNFTFVASDTKVDLDGVWNHIPNVFGQSIFGIVGVKTGPLQAAGIGLYAPTNGFDWQLDSDTSGALTASWLTQGRVVKLSANLTSLTAVSPVPEPSTYAMLLLGAAVVTGAAKRRAARRAA